MNLINFETLAALILLMAVALPWVFPGTFGQPGNTD
jgi:hypothetical protein